MDDSIKPKTPQSMKKARKKTGDDTGAPEKKKFEKKIPKKITESHLRNVALYYLQRYASSSQNLRAFLQRRIQRASKHHETNIPETYIWVEKIIVDYERVGLLNDEVFLASKLGSLRRKGESRRVVEMKLKQKGLDGAMIAEKLLAEEDDTEWVAALRHVERKRLGPHRLPSRIKDDVNYFEKDMAAMARAGFTYELAKKALKQNSA